MRVLAIVLLLCIAFGKRKAEASAQLAAAKTAYQEALSKTGDFDCAAPEFDEVLQKFDAVPSGTPSKKEAQGLAQAIREKRAAAAQHASAVDRAAAAPRGEPGASPAGGAVSSGGPGTSAAGVATAAPDKAVCKAAVKRTGALRSARKKAGKPAVGTMAFQPNGEVGFAPGAEPTPGEEQLSNQLKACGSRADEGGQ